MKNIMSIIIQVIHVLSLLCAIAVSMFGIIGDIVGYGKFEEILAAAGVSHGFDLLWYTGIVAVLLLIITYIIKLKL